MGLRSGSCDGIDRDFDRNPKERERERERERVHLIFIANGVLIPDFNNLVWHQNGTEKIKSHLTGIRKAYVPSFSIESENKNMAPSHFLCPISQDAMFLLTLNKCKDDDSSLSLLTVFRKKTVVILV